MIETMSGPPYKDPSSKPSASSSGTKSNLNTGSRVSFVINTPDSNPAAENLQRTSFSLGAMAGPSSRELSKESFHGSIPDPDIARSFLSLSMSQSYTQPSREMHAVPRPRASVTSTLLSLSRTGIDADLEPTGMPDISRLSPHRVPSRVPSDSNQVQKHTQAFKLSEEQLLFVKNSMQEALVRGLKYNIQGGSSLTIIPTYVCALPDGTEKGHFLALEMTQTDVNVLLLRMPEEDVQEPQIWSKKFPITEYIRKSTVDQLFEFLAECLEEFLLEIGTREKYIPLGFCFPFACKHVSLNKCYLLESSKNFWWSGMEGKNVAEQLQTAINNHCKDYQIEVIAVLNDTVATMLGCSSDDVPCEVGLVIDAGTNSCYMEQAQEITGIEIKEGRMCVNTEWGDFGRAGELDGLLTEFDLIMDKQSMNPKVHRFEKLISSLYICDTVRIMLAELAEKGELFSGVLTSTLLTRGKLEFQDIAEVVDEKEGLSKAKSVLLHLGMVASNEDCFHLQEICQAVFDRSAILCAAGLAAILTRIASVQKRPQLKINVAVDGVLYNSRKEYREILGETLKSLVPEYTVTFVPSHGSSALGVIMATAAEIRYRNQRQQVTQILAPFRLSLVELERLQNLMRLEMMKGLTLDHTATINMLPTFVCHLPDGSERGKFLALDLGGTNFRVLMVELKDPKEGGVTIVNETYSIPPDVAQSNAIKLFDHIVSCIVDFETKHKMLGISLPLGFTFSFPCSQIGLDKAILLTWTKGFSATGCVGEDVVQLLREALQRQKHVNVNVVAIVNDTVGTMVSCAYMDPKCEIGLIVGTGTNVCYMEEMKNMDAVEGKEGKMCVNTEWGAFGDSGCLDNFMTPFDVQVDAESLNAGQHRFEKLISGMYLGEIVRYILLELMTRKVLFQGQDSAVLRTKGVFPTKFLSDMEDHQGEELVCAMLEECKLTITAEDVRIVKEVCRTVSSRAAKLCAAGMAAILEKMRDNRHLEKLEMTVGVDGTLYKVHPKFSKELQETVSKLAPKCQVKFLLSEDGSGKGAALIAAVAHSKAK